MEFEDLSKEVKWSRENCKLCGICVSFCSQQSLKMKGNELKLEGKCIKCKLCEKYCPEMGIKIK
jgi:2-oxoglutarate ferredoxin oxidoreductase subunit delta